MTNTQRMFCDEYLKDFNATRAYKAAYKSCKTDGTANVNGSKLLRNTKVKEYIDQRKKELVQSAQITQGMIIQELAKMAFFNIKNVYNENGTLKNIKDIDDNTASAISEIKVLQRAGAMKIAPNDDIPVEHIPEQTIQIKTSDKKGALELLGKYLGMFKDKIQVEQDKPFEVNITVKK